VAADHRDERISRWLRLEKMRGGELCMVGDRIGAADFELDPKSFLPIIACKQYVSACSVTEHALPLVIEDVSFTSASPSRRTGSRETLLEKSGQASHLNFLAKL
jgi:hypothetical protein